MFVRFCKHPEKRKASRKKRLIRLAIILALLLPLAALRAAKGKEAAGFAFFGNSEAFADKIGCLFPGQRGFDRNRSNVAEQPLIGAVKIAGIKVSVALNNKLMCAVAAKGALLRPFAEIHSDVIVKLANADVISADKIFDI